MSSSSRVRTGLRSSSGRANLKPDAAGIINSESDVAQSTSSDSDAADSTSSELDAAESTSSDSDYSDEANEKRRPVILVDEEKRIFKVNGKTYCYSAEIFARMLHLPPGGADLRKVMKAFRENDISRHFKTKYLGDTGYKLEEFHNFGDRHNEQMVINLIKRWNDILLLPRYKKYCSRGAILAAMSYVVADAIREVPANFPAYQSNRLHVKIMNREAYESSSACKAIIKFHCKNRARNSVEQDHLDIRMAAMARADKPQPASYSPVFDGRTRIRYNFRILPRSKRSCQDARWELPVYHSPRCGHIGKSSSVSGKCLRHSGKRLHLSLRRTCGGVCAPKLTSG